MPELPEVESLRRSLLPHVIGKTIVQVRVSKPKLVTSSGNSRVASQHKKEEFERQLAGKKIVELRRRAKNLMFVLDSGECVLVHLKMTGQLVFVGEDNVQLWGGHPIELSEKMMPHKHSHIIFTLDSGTLYYNDTRMFGYVLYCVNFAQAETLGHFKAYGLEPTEPDFTVKAFVQGMQRKQGVLKTVLMNQAVVVGLGNIYADEVCFAAGVRPTRKVSTLAKKEVLNLFHAIKEILLAAITLGGSSIADYVLADGSRGNYAREHKVYGRAGKECLNCSTTLKKIVVNGRTTVYCPTCQK